MIVHSNHHSLHQALTAHRKDNLLVGFIPTMGHLHAGHIALVRHAQRSDTVRVVSIFVNPLQFGQNEDYARYPRTIETDCALLTQEGVEHLYAPSTNDLYPNIHHHTRINIPHIGAILCGRSRPNHFVGVATIIVKLLNIVRPETVFLGKKDYQQFILITQLVIDLCMDVKVVGVETVRESDGLALSSRNAYLSPSARRIAPVIYRTLVDTQKQLKAGERNFTLLCAQGTKQLQNADMTVDYYEIRNTNDLSEANSQSTEVIILVAVVLAQTRLIDNMIYRLT